MSLWQYDHAADGERAGEPRWPASPLPVAVVRSATAVVLRCWLRVYHRLTIVGRGNLPAGRSFVMIANHASHLDTVCLLAALPLGRMNRAFPIAARDYFCTSPVRACLVSLLVNAIPFERRFAPWYSLSKCADLLNRPGHVLILFPEGTRSNGRAVGEFKPGVALLAAGRDVPVVPCHLAGTHAALPRGGWVPRPAAVRLTIGSPRVYAHLPATRASAEQICRDLREAVLTLGHGEGDG